jgi:hypothetical protein
MSLGPEPAGSKVAQRRTGQHEGGSTENGSTEADRYDESDFRSLFHRLRYGLRHVQHHTGKLTAYLNLEGIQLQHWKG